MIKRVRIFHRHFICFKTILLLLGMIHSAWGATNDFILEGSLGTDGIGVGIEKPINPRWSIGVRLSTFSFDGDYEADDIDYEADLSQHSIATLIHWYPFSNQSKSSGFQVSAGIVSIQGDYLLEASGEDSYEVGDTTYTGNLTLNSEVQIPRVAPYVGFGWRNRNPSSGLGLGFDLGAVWLSDLDIIMSASGTATDDLGNNINISSNREFLDNLRDEENELETDVKDFIHPWVPVVRLSIDYRF